MIAREALADLVAPSRTFTAPVRPAFFLAMVSTRVVKRAIAAVIALLLSTLAYGWCNNCNSRGCCRCPGEAQCLGSFSTCEEACGLVRRPGSGQVYTPGPSPEEQRRMRDAKDSREAADHAYDKGVEAYDKGNWEQAVNYFRESLEHDPDNPDTRANLGKAEQKLRETREQQALEAARQRQQAEIERQRQDPGSGTIVGTPTAVVDPGVLRPAVPTNPRIAEIMRGIQRIQVPPPILPNDAAIGIGQLAPGDEMSRKIFHGMEHGVAVASIFGKIGPTVLPHAKLILATGNTIIAAQDAADVYLVRQNETYEKALRYLKDEKQRLRFTAIVRTLKEGRRLPEDASIDMVRAAQAILDPRLGSSSTRIAWNAMLSPEARHAAITRVGIELGSEIAGQAAASVFRRIQAVQYPAFREAQKLLNDASVGMRQTTDPVALESWRIAIGHANAKIAQTYHALEPASEGLAHIQSMYTRDTVVHDRTVAPGTGH